MSNHIRFGIVGTNFVSDSFMEGIKMTEGVSVSAVCSGRKENAIHFAQRYQIEHVFDDYQGMAAANTVDAVYIATPNSKHFEHASYFLKHHIPVFLEKPIVVNEIQAKELLSLAKSNKTYLHDGIMPLYSPNLDVLRQCISEIGKLRRVVISFQKYSSRYNAYLNGENPTTFRKELANGAFMDLGIYTISDAVALFGKPESISSNAYLLTTGVDGLNTILLKYPTFDVILMNSKITNTEIVSEIQGDLGIIQFGLPSTLQTITVTNQKGEKKQIPTNQSSPFHHQLEDFKNSINNKLQESVKVPHQLTIDILTTLTTCRKLSGVVYAEDV